MSSAERYRPTTVAYVLAVLLPLVLLVLLAAPLGIVLALGRGSPADPPPSTAGGSEVGAADEGRRGVDDPYFPNAGSSGYDALRYAISVDWDPDRQRLSGTTVITARASQRLRSFWVDLALPVGAVRVDGQPAAVHQSGADVRVTPAQPIAADARFEVVVQYAGGPRVLEGRGSAWSRAGREWVVAGEPDAAPWWFASNDHPSDPAVVDVSARVPTGLTAVSIGRLASRDAGREAGFDTWHWVSASPVATYLVFLAIGRYELQQGQMDGRPYVYAVSSQLSRRDRNRAMAALQQSGAIVRTLESMFGPYPFAELGGIVPASKLPFAGLETQTRPVYERRAILADDPRGLLAHELAHMWFGDAVTLRRWDDIADNEGYASWAQWGYTERTGGRSAEAALQAAYDRVRTNAAFWRVTMIDPGREHLFDAVYLRGPMLLQALRNVIGDPDFFALARSWGASRGSRSLEEWMVLAQANTRVNLLPFFQAWVYGTTCPARTAANGLR